MENIYKFVYTLRDLFISSDTFFYPYPMGEFWETSDSHQFYTYKAAVEHSKLHHLVRVEVNKWNETTQQWVQSKTFY